MKSEVSRQMETSEIEVENSKTVNENIPERRQLVKACGETVSDK